MHRRPARCLTASAARAVILFVDQRGTGANLDLLTKRQGAWDRRRCRRCDPRLTQMIPLAALMAFRSALAPSPSPNSAAWSARIVRFAADVLVGIPSILVGIFIFTLLVLPFHQFNAFAGSVALAF
jgi:hypothetical protein